MDLVGDLGTTEVGFVLLLAGSLLLAVVFAIQTVVLSRRLRKHKAHNEQMEEFAYLDPLTGLPNRRLLEDRLQQALHASERDGSSVAVHFIDLNNFKSINDRYDHSVGDQVLSGLVQRWKSELRAVDTLARWGGDEFVVVTSGITIADDIHSVVKRLKDAAAEPMIVMGNEIAINTNFGVAVGYLGTENSVDLIRCADAAMYRAKRSGNHESYEIVGRPESLKRITDLKFLPDIEANDAGYARINA